MIAGWAEVRGLMMEPRDALEAILARRALAVSALLGVAGYYVRTLVISEVLFASLGGVPGYLIGNCFVALGWMALVVSLVRVGAVLTGDRGAGWPELFALWGYTQIPFIILTALTSAIVFVLDPTSLRELDAAWLILGVAVAFLLSLWALLLKLHALRVWSGSSGWSLCRLVVVALVLYGAVAWGERLAVADRALVPAAAARAMEPTVAPLVSRRAAVTLPFDKLTYLVRPPHRGEIVSFVPADRGTGVWFAVFQARLAFIGRIIAAPGDRVEVRNGELFLNGSRLDEPYRVGRGTWSLPLTTVRPGQYLVLGDNRDVPPDTYQGGLVGTDRLRGRLTELGKTKWEFVAGKGRW